MNIQEVRVFGIKNCSTVKKTLVFLETKKLNLTFFDYKKQAPNKELLSEFCQNLDWQKVLNKKSQTWRNLEESKKLDLNLEKALTIMQENPSIIKRPIARVELKLENQKTKFEYLLGLDEITNFFNDF